ncbi:unnamed protein product [Peniophora sp. CBMAI 1063]|nr:unnamed protein product [Peniophora sp. CBMAI 1063]
MSGLSYATQARSVAVPGVDAVLDGQLYISSLSCAKTIDQHASFSHLVSVCSDLPRRNENHLIIPIQDTEYDDILDHLNAACDFIDRALASGGCVLVHCVMGVSRSATVIAAYLMKQRKITPSEALAVIAKRRPQIFPNYGFVKQLHVFAACNYAPASTHPAYRSWKRRQKQDVTQFLNLCHDTVLIVPGLYLNSKLPDDADQLRCLARYTGLSHLLTLSPAEIDSDIPTVDLHHVAIPSNDRSALVFSLSATCDYIQNALSSMTGRILVHSQTESIAALAVCAFLTRSRNLSAQAATQIVTDALPLFEASSNFTSALQAFVSYEHAKLKAVAAAVPVLGTANAVMSAATATVTTVASTLTSAPTMGLATGHRVRHSVELAPVRMAVQS